MHCQFQATPHFRILGKIFFKKQSSFSTRLNYKCVKTVVYIRQRHSKACRTHQPSTRLSTVHKLKWFYMVGKNQRVFHDTRFIFMQLTLLCPQVKFYWNTVPLTHLHVVKVMAAFAPQSRAVKLQQRSYGYKA